MKIYRTDSWEGRWYLFRNKITFYCRHPLIWLFGWNELRDDVDFVHARPYKRFVCWIKGHDEVDVEVGEHWASSMHVETDYSVACARCGEWC